MIEMPKTTLGYYQSKLRTLGLAVSVLMFSLEVNAQQAPLVEVASVESWEGGAEHRLHCIVQTNDVFQLTSHSQARLKWVLPPGSQVTKGQLIAEQDSYYLKRDIDRLRLELSSAQAQESFAAKEYARVQSLSHKSLVSNSRHNDMKRAARQSELHTKTVENQLQEALYRLKHTKHYATQDAQVLEKQAIAGDNLSDGDNILTLLPVEQRELLCELPVAKFKESQSLSNVSFSTIEGVPLVLNRFSQALEEQSQIVKVYLSTAKGSPLLLGERLEVSVSYHHSTMSRLPYDSVELTGEQAFVWQVSQDERITKIPVTIIKTQPQHVLVRSSLLPGQRIITIGKQGLKDKQLVKVTGNPVSQSMIGGAL